MLNKDIENDIDGAVASEDDLERIFPLSRKIYTPLIMQASPMESGAAAVAIILAYHKKFVPFDEIRQECGVTNYGDNLWGITHTLEKYGLETTMTKVDSQELQSAILPAILLWEFSHFVVFNGYSPDSYYINNPTIGPQRLSPEDFNKKFSGHIIEVEPTQNFVPSGSATDPLEGLVKELKSIRNPILFLLITTFLLLIPGLAWPALSMILVNQFLEQRALAWSGGVIIAGIIAIVMTAGLILLREHAYIYIRAKLSVQMTSKVIRYLLSRPLNYFSQEKQRGLLAWKFSLIESSIYIVVEKILRSIADLVMITMYGIVIFFYNPILSIFLITAAAFQCLFYWLMPKYKRESLASYYMTKEKADTNMVEMLALMQDIKAMSREEYYFSRWEGVYTTCCNYFHELKKKELLSTVFLPLIHGLALLALVAIAGIDIIQGIMSPGVFIALLMLVLNFMRPLQRFVDLGEELNILKTNMLHIHGWFQSSDKEPPPDAELIPITREYRKLNGAIEVSSLSFSYQAGGACALKDISFKVPPGSAIAIVGPTNTGKSTLLLLLAGLLTPTSGTITFDGILASELERELLGNSIALVGQKPYLFSGTIEDNLSLFNPLTPKGDLMQAASDACLHDKIMAKALGYQYVIHNGGANLSRGEQQCLDIARALVKKPSILLLDAFSFGDTGSKEQIIKNILRRGCTLVLVTTEIDQIRCCDYVYYIDEKRFVDMTSDKVGALQ